MPRLKKIVMPARAIFVEVSGGVVQNVTATYLDADVRLIDYDHMQEAGWDKKCSSCQAMKKNEMLMKKLRKANLLHNARLNV